MSHVEQYYDAKAEAEWQRLERHRVEFGLTMRALKEFLPAPPAAVLDIGGGPGRYAVELARREAIAQRAEGLEGAGIWPTCRNFETREVCPPADDRTFHDDDLAGDEEG